VNVNHKMKFFTFKDTILGNRSMFIYGDTGDDIAMDVIDAAVNDHVAAENENSEEENDANEANNEFEVLNDRTNEAGVFTDTGIDVQKKTADDISFPVPHLIDDESFNQMIRTLNKQQRKYLLHVLNCHKLNKLPRYECVLGEAGVGKSRLIQTLHQTLLRFYNNQEGTNLESLKVLICAPTGKAAFNIKDITLHSAFVLPLNQYGAEMPPLSSSISNTILSKLHDLKLIIIDEISMVGIKQFGQINLRLQQIFRSNELFAGKSIYHNVGRFQPTSSSW
jgi:nucleoside-triphosphatase THEP1